MSTNGASSLRHLLGGDKPILFTQSLSTLDTTHSDAVFIIPTNRLSLNSHGKGECMGECDEISGRDKARLLERENLDSVNLGM